MYLCKLTETESILSLIIVCNVYVAWRGVCMK